MVIFFLFSNLLCSLLISCNYQLYIIIEIPKNHSQLFFFWNKNFFYLNSTIPFWECGSIKRNRSRKNVTVFNLISTFWLHKGRDKKTLNETLIHMFFFFLNKHYITLIESQNPKLPEITNFLKIVKNQKLHQSPLITTK